MTNIMKATGLAAFCCLALRGTDATVTVARDTVVEDSAVNVNPIRRVVTMLQMMTKKVEEEGRIEKELYDKFMCWCESGATELETAIQAGETKIPQMESKISELEASIAQLKADIAKAKEDRKVALSAIAKVKVTHKKAEDKFAKVQADLLANIAALKKAIAALEKGMSGTFLQTRAAATLRNLVVSVDMGDTDRDVVTAFLSAGSGYTPQSGEVTGILKQMLDTMIGQLKEEKDVKGKETIDFEALIEAKLAETKALDHEIESKLGRLGEIMVEIVAIKEDLDDTSKGLVEDKKFLGNMDQICDAKRKEYEARRAMRAQELAALAETIKILNSDDTLELFKKTLPSASFMQMQNQGKELRGRALSDLQKARKGDFRLGLITTALRGGKVDFAKVIGMIDNMLKLLSEEQTDDDAKKMFCEKQLDMTEDSLKELNHKVSDLEKTIANSKELIATLADEIAALGAGIKDLDKQVADATEARKEEHEDQVEELAALNAAKDILLIAENRLNQFYNPKLYKAPPKRVLTEEERIFTNNGGTLAPTQAPASLAQVAEHHHRSRASAAVAPPPSTWAPYEKKSSSGVMEMMALLKADLDKDIQESTVDETHAQAEYEEFIADSAAKRAADLGALADKEGAKAEAGAELVKAQEEIKTTTKQEMATAEYLKDLHIECDWLLSNYDTRKEARAGEMESLSKAKAVLAGADYSLVQREAATQRLRGAR